jgi:amino acid transporter
LALGVNGIVGVGIFFVPAAVAASAPGLASVAAFALTGLALIPTALAFAILGRRFDEDGGPVVFARAAFGEKVSFLVGWVAYVSAFLSTAAVIMGLTGAIAPDMGLHGPWLQRSLASALVGVLALVVASGISISARVWTVLTIVKLVPLVALLAAFAGSDSAPAPAATGEVSWLRACLVVVFAFQGFEIVPVIAGQVRSARQAVPFATVGSLVLAIGLYLGLVWSCVVALPELAHVEAPLAEAGRYFGGPSLGRLVAIGTSVSALGISFGMLITTPRYLSSLAAGTRNLFNVDRMNARGVPRRALWLTWLLVTVLVNLGELHELFALSSIAVLMQYGVTAAALVSLAWRRQRQLRLRDAWPALFILPLCMTLVVFGATWRETVVALGVVLVGLILLRFAPPRRRGHQPL